MQYEKYILIVINLYELVGKELALGVQSDGVG